MDPDTPEGRAAFEALNNALAEILVAMTERRAAARKQRAA